SAPPRRSRLWRTSCGPPSAPRGATGCRRGRRERAAWCVETLSVLSFSRLLLTPDLVGQLDDHPQLRPLLFLGEHVALLGRGETALRRQAELVERNVFRCFIDTALELVLAFQRARLGRDEA